MEAMDNERIKRILSGFVDKYAIRRMVLFGSRADGTNREDSDVDLIVEFSIPVSLITLSTLKIEMEEALGLCVDIVHGPIQQDDILEINNEVVLYAA